MQNLSMNQALSIWSDLDDAFHGENGFGGDTAEIYIYRLMPYEPYAQREQALHVKHGGCGGEWVDIRDTIPGALNGPWRCNRCGTVTPTLEPEMGLSNRMAIEMYDRACESLHAILAHFASARSTSIEVDGRAFGDWIKRERFTHRVHVRVRPRSGASKRDDGLRAAIERLRDLLGDVLHELPDGPTKQEVIAVLGTETKSE